MNGHPNDAEASDAYLGEDPGEIPNMKARAVTPFVVDVLGGIFRVREVLGPESDSTEAIIERIRVAPLDRWFVIVSDGDVDSDALGMIDEQLAIRVFAQGTVAQR